MLMLQNICDHIETQASHWNVRSCRRSPIRTWYIYDVLGGQRPRCVASCLIHLGSTLMQARFCLIAHPVLEVDFPDGHICIYGQTRMEEIAYTIFSLLFGKGLTIMFPFLIDISGRFGDVYCRRDPPGLASPVVCQDAVYRVYDHQGYHRLCLPSVHIPHYLRDPIV